MRYLINALGHRLRGAWCIVTSRCSLHLETNDLKRDDATFGDHLDWMKQKENASRQRQEHVLENVFLPKQRRINEEDT